MATVVNYKKDSPWQDLSKGLETMNQQILEVYKIKSDQDLAREMQQLKAEQQKELLTMKNLADIDLQAKQHGFDVAIMKDKFDQDWKILQEKFGFEKDMAQHMKDLEWNNRLKELAIALPHEEKMMDLKHRYGMTELKAEGQIRKGEQIGQQNFLRTENRLDRESAERIAGLRQNLREASSALKSIQDMEKRKLEFYKLAGDMMYKTESGSAEEKAQVATLLNNAQLDTGIHIGRIKVDRNGKWYLPESWESTFYKMDPLEGTQPEEDDEIIWED